MIPMMVQLLRTFSQVVSSPEYKVLMVLSFDFQPGCELP